VRLVALERGHRRLLQVAISELDDLQLQRYIRFNIRLIQSGKRCVFFFKFLHKLGLKELKGHSKELYSLIDAPKKENVNTW